MHILLNNENVRHVNDSTFYEPIQYGFQKIELIQLMTQNILNEVIRFNS